MLNRNTDKYTIDHILIPKNDIRIKNILSPKLSYMYPIVINIRPELIMCPKLHRYKTVINMASLCHNSINPVPV